MGESRVEKFREYRNSIMNDNSLNSKVEIDTCLKACAVDELPDEQKVILLRKLSKRKLFWTIFLSLIIITVLVLLVVFGLKYF